MNDDDRIEGRLHGEQPDVPKEAMLNRLLYMVILWIMLQLAQTILGVVTIVQFIIMAVSDRKPNERLADFGTDLGVWIAKAARYQTAASEVKPWPWTELD
ncbi:hypothetical protein ACMU_11265 [Actibacterium mucosum KCTC 23349]|uniref:Lipase n=1 Tax=Actibacterium mucosum KCTC 23349 TaxID=1454373 RepID=A0A037ZI92_9RHOB|nr:DUF4389 domain-containing protein [Actibacterium mucosum]KAJ55272.1 hypothetical protein ACMU_11265 [Actibacterium mucosum KCTC 23349]